MKKFFALALPGLICVVAVCLGGVLLAVYRGQSEEPFVIRAAGWLHLPAARAAGQTILYADYVVQLAAERHFLASPLSQGQGLPRVPGPKQKQEVLQRLIRTAVIHAWAREKSVIVTPLDVDRAFETLMAQAGTSTTPQDIQAFLNDSFGWDEARFKRYVVEPALTEETIRHQLGKDPKEANAFDVQIRQRLTAPDVKAYLKF